MVERLYRLTDDGVSLFYQSLQSVRDGDKAELPAALLSEERYACRVEKKTLVTKLGFSSKLEVAMYLAERIDFRSDPKLLYDRYLWSWLAVFYFDIICPMTDGGRKVGADYRYIPTEGVYWRNYYRHLLAGPVRLYLTHGQYAKLPLSPLPSVGGEVYEQLASRQAFASGPGIMQAAEMLYWDRARAKPKVGAAPNNRRPGTLRRFIDVVRQFDLTFDLYDMTGEQVVSLLPEEFNKWIPDEEGAVS